MGLSIKWMMPSIDGSQMVYVVSTTGPPGSPTMIFYWSIFPPLHSQRWVSLPFILTGCCLPI